MTRDEAKGIIEVFLFVSDRPLPIERISQILEGVDRNTIRSIIDELNDDYTKKNLR